MSDIVDSLQAAEVSDRTTEATDGTIKTTYRIARATDVTIEVTDRTAKATDVVPADG